MAGEGAFLLFLQEQVRNPVLDAFFSFYTQLGDGGLMFLLLAAVLLCFPKTRKAGFAALCALAVGVLCTNVVLKHLFARPRPWLEVAGLIPLVEEHDPNSFPSGHTCAAFAFAVAMLWGLSGTWKKVLVLGMAVLMGFSRLYVGVHYPTDVLCGMLVGMLAGFLGIQIVKFIDQKRLSR